MCLIYTGIRDIHRKQLFIDLCDRADDRRRGGSVSPCSSTCPLVLVRERRKVALGPPYESACRQERGLARCAPARSPPPRTPRRAQAIQPSRPPALPTDATPQHGLAHLLHDSFGRARAARSVITSSLALPPPPPLGGMTLCKLG